MNFGRSNSLGESHQFFKIKDLHFFRNLLWKHDFSLIKDFLHNSLQIFNMLTYCSYTLDHNYIYIVGEQAIFRTHERDSINIKAGYVIPVCFNEIIPENCFSVYRIRSKTVLILQELYFLDLQLTNGMKSSEKLGFLEECQLEELHFNAFAYRKGQIIDSIYYLLEGQIKMFKEIAGNVYEVASLEKGRLFGLFQIKSAIKCRQLHAKAGQNHTKILKIPLRLLQQKCIEEETTIQALISGIKTQIYSIFQNTPAGRKTWKNYKDKQNNSLQASKIQLQRRLKTFQSSRMIKSSVIQNLVYSKKILYKVKELNQRMQSKIGKNNFMQIQNIHEIKHFNDKWKSKKDKRSMQTPEPIKSPQNNTALDPLRRLMKYPSVQRFLGKQTKQRASVDEIMIRVQRQ